MNEELYQLIDGDLSDESMAALFRDLSENPQGRRVFRQELRLQNELHRNERYDGLTVDEETAMLEHLGAGISAGSTTAAGTSFAGKAAAAVLILLLGIGIGYFGHDAVTPENSTTAATTIAVEPVPLPFPIPNVVNHDSLVSTLRDSLRVEMEKEQQQSKRRSYRRPHRGAVTGK